MWMEYNPNPVSNNVEDCAVRAVSVALGISWDDAFDMIARNAKQMGVMMHNNNAWGSVLRQNGFYRAIIPNTCPDCYTAEDFCRDHPRGIYVLGFGTHTATVIDGNIIDSWDSSEELPHYFWYKKEY